MITDHVPAVRVPRDHATIRVAAAVPARGGVEDRRDLDPAPVGAENPVTLCDLGVFVDQTAEPVPPQHPDIRASCRRM